MMPALAATPADPAILEAGQRSDPSAAASDAFATMMGALMPAVPQDGGASDDATGNDPAPSDGAKPEADDPAVLQAMPLAAPPAFAVAIAPALSLLRSLPTPRVAASLPAATASAGLALPLPSDRTMVLASPAKTEQAADLSGSLAIGRSDPPLAGIAGEGGADARSAGTGQLPPSSSIVTADLLARRMDAAAASGATDPAPLPTPNVGALAAHMAAPAIQTSAGEAPPVAARSEGAAADRGDRGSPARIARPTSAASATDPRRAAYDPAVGRATFSVSSPTGPDATFRMGESLPPSAPILPMVAAPSDPATSAIAVPPEPATVSDRAIPPVPPGSSEAADGPLPRFGATANPGTVRTPNVAAGRTAREATRPIAVGPSQRPASPSLTSRAPAQVDVMATSAPSSDRARKDGDAATLSRSDSAISPGTDVASAVSTEAAPRAAPAPSPDRIVPRTDTASAAPMLAPAQPRQPLASGRADDAPPPTAASRRAVRRAEVAEIAITGADDGSQAHVPADVTAAPAVADASARLAAAGADRQLGLARTNAWADGIARDIAAATGANGSARFTVAPEALGTVQVEVRRDGDVADVAIVAASADARALIEDARPQLVAAGHAHGIAIRHAEVTVAAPDPQPSASAPAVTDASATISLPARGYAGGGGTADGGSSGRQQQRQDVDAPRAAARPAMTVPSPGRDEDLYA